MNERCISMLLSVVLVARGRPTELRDALTRLSQRLAERVSDHEIIVIDNAESETTLHTLRELTGVGGLPNLQVYALVERVDDDTAAWVGVENALGDYVAVIDLGGGDADIVDALLDGLGSETDMVFAQAGGAARPRWPSRVVSACLALCYRVFTGSRLTVHTAPHHLHSRRVLNYVKQHPFPVLTYQNLPSAGGFVRSYVSCASAHAIRPRGLMAGADVALRLLVSQTHRPIRLVSAIAVFGAVANLVYAAYIVGIAVFKDSVQPGWVTLSLQQSGMFLLISLAIGVLGEYTGQLSRASNEGPRYHVAREFTSAHVTRRARINVDEAAASESSMGEGEPLRLGA